MNQCQWAPVAFLGLCALAGPARADLVTINFSGHVTERTDPTNLLPPSFGTLGAPVTGVLQYDTAVPPLIPGLNISDYAFTKFSLSLNGTTLPGQVSLGFDVTVTNALFLGAMLHAGGTINNPGLFPNFSGGNIAFDLSDPTATAFSGVSLPTSLSLAAFPSKTFQINLQANDPPGIAPTVDRSASIFGNIDTLSVDVAKPQQVPEPASCLLFGIGLLGTAALARRRRAAGPRA
jgi:hypothetical protein